MAVRARTLFVICSLVAHAAEIQVRASDFGPAKPFEAFWDTQPLGPLIMPPDGATPWPDLNNSALGCAAPPLGRCMFASDDPWLKKTLPMWKPKGRVTIPFTTKISAVRTLGGHAQQVDDSDVWIPLPEWDLVTRDIEGSLAYNWTRLDQTMDPFVDAGITPSPLVLDNVPYTFVSEEHWYFAKFGLGNAPDNATEFAGFIEAMVRHLVDRYGAEEVARWRFRLGTEANGPRMGPRWQAEADVEHRADGSPITFSNRSGIEAYVETYIATAAAVKRASPRSAFGASNFAGLGLDASAEHTFLDEFADRIHAAGAPFDFGAMSEYSHHDSDGNAPAQLMTKPVQRLAQIARRAVTGSQDGEGAPVPLEVHEYGWASWGKNNNKVDWPHGAFGASYCVATWLWQRWAGIENVFHWGYHFDASLQHVGAAVEGPLVSGWGWVYAAMQTLLGTDRHTMGAEFVQDLGSDVASYNNTFGAFRTTKPEERQLQYLFVAHSANYSEHSTHDIGLRIGTADFRPGHPFFDLGNPGSFEIAQQFFNMSTSVHDAIQRDLEAAGGYPTLLTVTAAEATSDSVRVMATEEGLRRVAADADQYMEMSKVSLRSVPFTGSVEFEQSKQELVLRFRMQTPSLVLLTVAPSQQVHV